MPMVSIIIPTFNNNTTVYKAIDSALKQSYSNVEIILVDDFSRENIALELQSYCKYNNVKYIRNKFNLGYKKNFDFCWNLATGKYVILLHHDDRMLDRMIEKYVEVLELNPKVGAICSRSLQNVNNKITNSKTLSNKNKAVRIYSMQDFFTLYLTEGHPEIATLMLRTKMIQESESLYFYHADMLFYDDYCFWIDLSIQTSIAICSYPFLVRGITKNQTGYIERNRGKQNKKLYCDLMFKYIEWVYRKINIYCVDKVLLNSWLKINACRYYLIYANKVNKTNLFNFINKNDFISNNTLCSTYNIYVFIVFLPYPIDACVYEIGRIIKNVIKCIKI